MEAALSSGGPTVRCGVFHMKHLLCYQSRSAANGARGKIQCCQLWKGSVLQQMATLFVPCCPVRCIRWFFYRWEWRESERVAGRSVSLYMWIYCYYIRCCYLKFCAPLLRAARFVVDPSTYRWRCINNRKSVQASVPVAARDVNFTRKFLKRCATQQIENFVTVVYFFVEGNFEMTWEWNGIGIPVGRLEGGRKGVGAPDFFLDFISSPIQEILCGESHAPVLLHGIIWLCT